MTASTLSGLTVYLSSLNFGKWYLSRKLAISSIFSSLVEYRFLKYVLTILLILLASVVVPLFVSNFVNIDIFLHILVSLVKGLSILFTFSKNQLFASLIFYIILFISILLISVLSLIILAILDVHTSFCSRALRYAVKLLVWNLCNYFT